jgi:hypothetical protein
MRATLLSVVVVVNPAASVTSNDVSLVTFVAAAAAAAAYGRLNDDRQRSIHATQELKINCSN